jgi:acyl transferase domain-containing protein/NADPH:quinone reductase-like Zn-dependent oxidoreductase/SAM-dependent methyltransferase/acyl carrier protein
LPGGADTPAKLWQLLIDGVNAIKKTPQDRWDTNAYYHPDPNRPGKMYTRAGGYLRNIDLFDAGFFGISPREARRMDPQHRLLLEMAWEALEDAGQVPERLAGTDTSVFIGISSGDYGQMQLDDPETMNAYSNVGNAASIAANRLSHFFDLRGPSMAIDTACSSSVVALHEACQSIWHGESAMSLAGGINIILAPHLTIGFCKAAMLSPHDRCHSFDAAADGYVRAEGGGVFVLKPLSSALADGDPIHATILASAVNCDGHTKGIFFPSETAQADLLREVYRRGGVSPGDVCYVEAHGTGTSAGDPIECTAIGRVMGADRDPGDRCLIGSIKSNLGHLESASGVASVIKVVLSLQHRELPATNNFKKPNPNIPFDDLNLEVVKENTPLNDHQPLLVMGVNSFGFGGANAHVIIQEYREPVASDPDLPEDRAIPLLLSARSAEALSQMAEDFERVLRQPDGQSLYDVCYTAAFRRSRLDHRLVVFGKTPADIAGKLAAFAKGEYPEATASDKALSKSAKLAFVFSGNGPQWWGMGQELLKTEPVFRKVVEEIDAILTPMADWSLMEELLAGEHDSRMHKTEFAQPALFAVQLGILNVLRSRGLHADAVLGHSVGEVAAAYASGALSLEQAVRVIHERSKHQAVTVGQGKMAAIGLPLAEAEAAIDRYHGSLAIASINSPNAVTVSGDVESLEKLGSELRASDVFFRILDLNYAFHSNTMDPIQAPLMDGLKDLARRETTVRFVSTVTGDDVAGSKLGPEYWWKNVRKPVRFADGIGRLIDDGFEVFLEIGPHPVVATYLGECAKAKGSQAKAAATLRRDEPEQNALFVAVGNCHALGCELDLKSFFPTPGRCVSLPIYPWERERHWHETARERPDHPLLGYRVQAADPLWINRLDTPRVSYLADHAVQGTVVFPAAGYLEMALAAAHETFKGQSYELEDIDIRRALAIPQDQAPDIQLSISREDGSFKICSRPNRDQGSWTVNVVGKLGITSSSAAPAAVSIDAIRSRMTRRISKELHYQTAARLGIQYGPRFQGVKEVFARSDEALGRIDVPRTLRSNRAGYHLHPALLDACFQIVFAMVEVETGVSDEALYLPVQIKRLRFYGNPKAVRYCHARRQRGSVGSIVVEYRLLDAKGGIIAEVEGFRCQRFEFERGIAGNTPLYECRPQLQPGASPVDVPVVAELQDLGTLGDRLAPKIADLASQLQREDHHRRFKRRFDVLCAAYAARALEQLGARGSPFTIESLMLSAEERARRRERHARTGSAVSEPSPIAVARTALKSRNHLKVSEYLENALPEPVKAAWPRTRSGRLKVDRKTLDQFSDRVEVAALLKAEDGAVLPVYERYLARLVDMLEQEGNLHKSEAGWELVAGATLPDAENLWRELVADDPAALAMLLLLGRCGEQLASVLTGAVDPLKIIGLGTLEHLYESAPEFHFYNRAIEEVILEIVRAWPANRALRILEIGAGTGGLATNILPCLPKDRTEYVFTDVSDVFLSNAELKFSGYEFMRYELLDIGRDPVEQGFAAHGYDIVIAANVLHATPDLRHALGNSRRLLAKDGLLVLMEVHEARVLDLIFGLLKDWWAFEDFELRPRLPLLSPEQWPSVLEGVGFADVVTLNDAAAGAAPFQSVFLARNPTVEAAGDTSMAREDRPASSWLVFADNALQSGRGDDLASALMELGHRVITVYPGPQFERIDERTFALAPHDLEGFVELCRILRNERVTCDEVVHLWGLTTTPAESADELMARQDRRCLSTILLLQGLQKSGWPKMPRLWLITSGAVPHPGLEAGVIPSQAPLWGLGRVIENELPEIECKLVDLHPASDPDTIDRLLLAELRSPDEESEILLSEGARSVNRIRRTSIGEQAARFKAAIGAADETPSFELDFSTQGSLDNLYLRAAPNQQPGPGQVLVKVRATGLNFRDVMWTMGMLPGEALENGYAGATLGMECSGEIVEVGAEVTGFDAGDEVIAFAAPAFASHVLVDTTSLAPKPKRFTFEEAATIPVVFFTAFYALDTLARLGPGERVLIHGAAGGVGLAAIQIAKLRGAEIFATAGTPEKRDFVRMLGADHVLDSRSLAFADEIMEITAGEGVDVVLNSLAGEAIHKSLNVLKPFGRFLEIGKRDIFANSKLGLRPFRNNISYFAIDADQLMGERPDVAERIFRQVMDLLEEGVLHPLVHRTFPISRAVDAFRHMQQSKHIGKIVVSMDDRHLEIASADGRVLELREDGTYLITGGLGGFGLASAQWMVEKGARHLVLVGRRGAATAEAEAGIKELEAAGAKVLAAKADVTRADQLQGVLQRVEREFPPLRGILHAAMVLDDGLVLQLDRERLLRAMEPKVLGAWNLHCQTLDKPLDFFILYSSAATMVGNPGQGNYVAANLYLEALASYRRSQGLPALAVSWGSIDDVGYLARNQELKEILEKRGGSRAINSRQALDVLEQLLLAGSIQATAADFYWPKVLKGLPSADLPKFDYVRRQAPDDSGESGQLESFRDLLLELPTEERLGMVTQLLAEQVAKTLRMSVDKLDVNRSLLDMGIDSLMGVEMQMTIEKQFGVDFPTVELVGGVSISGMAKRILELVSLAVGSPSTAGGNSGEALYKELEKDLDEVSDEAIAAYLDETVTSEQKEPERVQ